jgi:hypothetical protein
MSLHKIVRRKIQPFVKTEPNLLRRNKKATHRNIAITNNTRASRETL